MHKLCLGDFTVDPAAGEMVGPAGREQLDPKVMQVLVVLARHAGSVVPRHELLEQVWPGVVVGDDVVSRCIYQLRRHLKQAGGDDRYTSLVETLPKRGYRLNCEAPSVPPATFRQPANRSRRLSGASPTMPPTADSRRRSNRLRAGIIAFALVAAASAFWLLQRADYFWRNPLAGARFTRMTDFEGVAPGVAIARDGKLVAFLASREGQLDAWSSRPGTGEFRNLTQGRMRQFELENASVRGLAITPDASRVTLWTRFIDASGAESIHTWAVPASGGQPQRYLDNAAEVDWSPDGTRIVYHPAALGDPLFVTAPNRKTGRQVYIAPPGVHCHFPVWSPDGRFVYFVQGRPPDEMDIWRIAPDGSRPERVTFHGARVAYPVFLDRRTLLYLATAEDGSGPWLHGVDVERGVPHRIGFGLEQYTSLAASADGRRLVATRSTPRTSLWRVPVMERTAVESDAERISLSVTGGRSPRFGPGYLLFVSPSDGSGIRKLAEGGSAATELWNGGRHGRVAGGPAIEPLTRRIAFSVATKEKTQLQVMSDQGTGVRTPAADLQVKGAPAWAPDGKSIVVAADQGQGTRLYRVPLDGTPAVPIVDEYSRDAVWSPDGRLLVYDGAELGPTFPVKAISADGRPHALPNVQLPRGARRLVFLPGGRSLVVLKGEPRHRNFWVVDLDTGHERQLTAFDREVTIGDFDVSADGSEIVFDRLREESDVVQIDLARR